MEKIKKHELEKWLSRVELSHVICPYCRETKHDYLCPDNGTLRPLDCECEKKFKLFEDAKDSLLRAVYNVRMRGNFNDSKLCSDDRAYVRETERTIEKLNQALAQFRALELRSAYLPGETLLGQ